MAFFVIGYAEMILIHISGQAYSAGHWTCSELELVSTNLINIVGLQLNCFGISCWFYNIFQGVFFFRVVKVIPVVND